MKQRETEQCRRVLPTVMFDKTINKLLTAILNAEKERRATERSEELEEMREKGNKKKKGRDKRMRW